MIYELRRQLQVSVQGCAQLQQHTDDINALKAQLKAWNGEQIELKRQAGEIQELKAHLRMSAKHEREMTRQASILDDLQAQLSSSHEVNLDLVYQRSSLDEARAIMAQALRTQHQGFESSKALSPTMSFTRMRPSHMQVRTLDHQALHANTTT